MGSESDATASECRDKFNIFKVITGDEDLSEDLAWNLSLSSTEVYKNLLSVLVVEESDVVVRNRELCRQYLDSIYPNERLNKPSHKRERETLSSESKSTEIKLQPKKVLFSFSSDIKCNYVVVSPIEESSDSNNKFDSSRIFPKLNLQLKYFIGGGSFGKVYAYEDKFSLKMYAIKKILIDRNVNIEDTVQRYKRESDILSQLDSKGLFTECVNAFVHQDNSGLYFCIQMPLFEMTIDKFVLEFRKRKDSKWFAYWLISALMQEVFDAVEIMHDNGFIHRDLKPANILISFQGSQSMVKVGDFGFARQLKSQNPVSCVNDSQLVELGGNNSINQVYNLTSYICGTELYMPPNVVDDGIFVPKDDIYSLGIIYSELLVRFEKNPSGRDFAKLVLGPRTELFNSFPFFENGANIALEQLIKQMIEFDSKKRLPIREAKKVNLLISFVLSNCKNETGINSSQDGTVLVSNLFPFHTFNKSLCRNYLEDFLNEIINNKNNVLIEHYKKIYATSLPTVLDNIKSLNSKIEKDFADFKIIEKNKSEIIKNSRLSPSEESSLIQYLNKFNIFATDRNQREKGEKHVVVPYEELDESFVFTIGHYLQDIYENDSDSAALLEFSDLQVIVTNFGEKNASLKTHVKKWNKVAMLSVRWTCFEAFLRRLTSQISNEEQILKNILILLKREGIVSLLSALIDYWHPKPIPGELWKSLFDLSAVIKCSTLDEKNKESFEKYREILISKCLKAQPMNLMNKPFILPQGLIILD